MSRIGDIQRPAHPVGPRAVAVPQIVGVGQYRKVVVPPVAKGPVIALNAGNGFVKHVEHHCTTHGLAVLVGNAESPVLHVARHEFVAERCGAHLHSLGLVGILKHDSLFPQFCAVVGDKLDCHVLTCLLGQQDGEVVHALVVGEPPLGDDLIGSRCHIINIGFGRRNADGDMAHVLLVHALLQRCEPQRAILDGCRLVGLAVEGNHALHVHVLLALLGIQDVDFEFVLA